jgi:serine/threonine protein kinase
VKRSRKCEQAISRRTRATSLSSCLLRVRPNPRLRTEFFQRECGALSELRHPAIIELLEWGTDEATGERFLVLAWMDDTLESRRGDTFGGWDSFYDDVGRPILEALSFAHRRRVWHRELKPATILLDAAGRPKLADFSIAKVDQRWDPSHTLGPAAFWPGSSAHAC